MACRIAWPRFLSRATGAASGYTSALHPAIATRDAARVLTEAETNSFALLLALREADSPLNEVHLHPGILAVTSMIADMTLSELSRLSLKRFFVARSIWIVCVELFQRDCAVEQASGA
jgi:hypothetical protein